MQHSSSPIIITKKNIYFFVLIEEYFFVLSKLNVCVKSFPFHVLMILKKWARRHGRRDIQMKENEKARS